MPPPFFYHQGENIFYPRSASHFSIFFAEYTKPMYDFVRDGRFFKNTKGRGGRPLECEVVQCRCGAWASTKLVHTPHHLGSTDHREWATTHGETLVHSYRKRGKSESEATESSSPVSTPTSDLDTALLTESNKPRSPLCPQWYADEEGGVD
jgi:hypothetical protein